MKNKVLDYIKQHGGVTYVEIEDIFDENKFDWKGDLVMCSSENPNIIFWSGWNEEACNIINELQNEKLIKKQTCESLVYFIDGKTLKLPIAKRNYKYKKVHWLPVVFN